MELLFYWVKKALCNILYTELPFRGVLDSQNLCWDFQNSMVFLLSLYSWTSKIRVFEVRDSKHFKFSRSPVIYLIWLP